MKTHIDGSHPLHGEIFVFGSNLAGVHGAGAAKAARNIYGARLGTGVGMTGRAYAIPTKDHHIKTLPIDEIAVYVEQFVAFTQEKNDMEFFITRVGCGLAGYKDEQIAPLFKGIGNNCSVPEQWIKYLT